MRQDIFDWLEGLARAGTRDTRCEDGTVPGKEFFTLARDLGESLGTSDSHETIFYADQLLKTFAHYLK